MARRHKNRTESYSDGCNIMIFEPANFEESNWCAQTSAVFSWRWASWPEWRHFYNDGCSTSPHLSATWSSRYSCRSQNCVESKPWPQSTVASSWAQKLSVEKWRNTALAPKPAAKHLRQPRSAQEFELCGRLFVEQACFL